jgi:hypothetical protein
LVFVKKTRLKQMGRKNMPPGPGRPKGKKNKLARGIVEKILQINEKLDKEGKGLEDCAREDPSWFHSHFTKGLIPKEINLDLGESASNLIERLTKALGRSSKS